MKFISLDALCHTLRERKWWTFCAAIATDTPMLVSPNLRVL
ncbi:MAG TPA: hypothetical protein VMG60_00740 [Burkholderiaceae bacterium]|nr:hypothetical protein [Burkholderiaceae bacterium]